MVDVMAMAEHGLRRVKPRVLLVDVIAFPERLRTRDGVLLYSPAMIVAKKQTSASAADAPRRAILSVLSPSTQHARSAAAVLLLWVTLIDNATIAASRDGRASRRCEEGGAETVPVCPEVRCGGVARIVGEERSACDRL